VTAIIFFDSCGCEIEFSDSSIRIPNQKNMDLKQLKAFLTVAETGNVTRAAEVLHLVQPAVTRQLKLLEDDIGARLFDRERHGMVLTAAGHSLIAYARRAMLELERARAEIAGADSGIGGLVTLGLLPSSIDALAGPLVTALGAEFGYASPWVMRAHC
jgi:LysR family transcriptional regulator, nitrogen assimilation regulatory protein